jgi:DNA-binding transcriptional LysR family regulator
MCRAAVLGLGVTLISKPDALLYLDSDELVRLVPQWYADAGPISLYYAGRSFLHGAVFQVTLSSAWNETSDGWLSGDGFLSRRSHKPG